MSEPSGINLAPYHLAVSGLRQAGVDIREVRNRDGLAVYMPDKNGVMRQSNILAVIERWREAR